MTSSKHLGSLENCIKGTTQDLMEKHAKFINRNNKLLQEFPFTYPVTFIQANNIFNTAFYGSVLWNLFENEAERLEKTLNVSQRLMLSWHRKTHCFFIEPLSKSKHIMLSLSQRFIKFTQKLSQSKKAPVISLQLSKI